MASRRRAANHFGRVSDYAVILRGTQELNVEMSAQREASRTGSTGTLPALDATTGCTGKIASIVRAEGRKWSLIPVGRDANAMVANVVCCQRA